MSGVELPVRTPFGNSIARLRNNGDHSIEGDSLRPDLVFAVTFFETPSLVPSLRPDGLPETHAALAGGGGPEEALRRLLGEAAGANRASLLRVGRACLCFFKTCCTS